MTLSMEKAREIVDAIARRRQERVDAGLCCWVHEDGTYCDAKADGPMSKLFFGEDHCAEHARAAELECLIDDQEDDANERGVHRWEP